MAVVDFQLAINSTPLILFLIIIKNRGRGLDKGCGLGSIACPFYDGCKIDMINGESSGFTCT
jgi:hypothetical protein